MDKTKNSEIRLGGSFSESERHSIIKEYLEGDLCKTEVWRKHTGQNEEHGSILKWMRMYGYQDSKPKRNVIFGSINLVEVGKQNDDLNNDELRAKIKKLEEELQNSQLKEEGYRLMIELAEKEFKIPIVKKPDTK